jgi:hypothetical protein
MRSLLLIGSNRHYRFVEAETGAAGLRAYQEAAAAPYDCVLLDYNLVLRVFISIQRLVDPCTQADHFIWSCAIWSLVQKRNQAK